jgi:hypothetical protein
MTNWFKQNPFLGSTVIAAVVVIFAGGYLVSGEATRLGDELESFESKKTQLAQLKGNKPFPDAANLQQTESETAQAKALLDQLAGSFRIDTPATGPQAFQDALSKAVKEVSDLAASKGVGVPEDFYLGFETYKTQPPTEQAAPQLDLQLRSIRAVAEALIESKVTALGTFSPAPLTSESPKEEAVSADAKKGNRGKERSPQPTSFGMAPFDVNFTADQASFRLAFNRILEIAPPVFVRLVSVANSQPAAPAKNQPEEASTVTGQEPPSSAIRPLFGRETLTVDLRLASTMGTSANP